MSQTRLFACLDIGRTLIHLMVGRLQETDGSIEVCKVGLLPSSGIHQGKVQDPRELSDAIRRAVLLAEHDLGQTIPGFYFGVDAMLTKLKKVEALTRFSTPNHSISKADVEQLMGALRYDEREALHNDIDLFPVIYTLDRGRVTLNPIQMQSSLLGVKGFLLQRRDDTLLQMLRSLRYARVKIDGLLHIGMTVGEVFLTREEKLQGAVIMDLGAEGSKFYYFRSGFLQGDVFIPIGGRTFTRDIEIVLRCSYVEAEQLKFRYGFNSASSVAASQSAVETTKLTVDSDYSQYPHEELIPQILTARLEQLLTMARQEFSQLGINAAGSSLKLMGGETMILGFEESIRALWSGGAEILKPTLSQVALPTFTSVFAMVHYVAKLYQPQTQDTAASSWIDLDSEHMELLPYIAETEEPAPNNVDAESSSIDFLTEKPTELKSIPEKDETLKEEVQRNQSSKSRIEGWRRWFGGRSG